MCGIVGFLGGDSLTNKTRAEVLERMSTKLTTRGPDSSGDWLDPDQKISLAHRRLAIMDLSVAGHQPMFSPSERYVISYNGEIYNNRDIKFELENLGEAPRWRGSSDTEILLAAFEAWGITETIKRIKGMFAIAVWDTVLRRLTLVRDRLGEKPLYYGWQGSGLNKSFLFGSELKALKEHPQFNGKIDRRSLALYMRYCYVPAPYSIFEGINKLEPGTILTVALTDNELSIERYWDTLKVVKDGRKTPFEKTSTQIADDLESLLRKTIDQQMIADVPLGAFLSGGVDSSLIASLMQEQHSHPVKTFTIGFNEAGYNEAEFAGAVARHLGTDHTELYVSSQDALNVIPKLPSLYCEPFADPSQIPTFLVSKLAQQHVTVCLSGDGGDELFCGYNRYIYTEKVWRSLSLLPAAVRKVIGDSVTGISASRWKNLFSVLNQITPEKFNGISFGDKLQKAAGVISSEDSTELYKRLVSNWQDPSTVVIGGNEYEDVFSENIKILDGLSDIERMMGSDLVSYLPDDILVKIDRAAMGVSLETRVPFLDHNIVEFSSKIPTSISLKNGNSKSVLREILYRHVPKDLIERPKMGFGIPVADWLIGPLRDWAEQLLDETLLRKQGYFRPEIVRSMWAEHTLGIRNWQLQLWAILMFQSWLEEINN